MKLAFLSLGDRYDYPNPFLRKEEAVVKDLGVHVLDLVFLNEAS